VLATGVIAIPPSGPETVYSVKGFNLVLQINKQTDDSTLLDIQTRLSDKKKREISDYLNDTLTNPCGQSSQKQLCHPTLRICQIWEVMKKIQAISIPQM
jgi:hypothetical protein